MSTIETNLVQPSTGTNLQLGASGDTVTIPSGATIDASAATATGFAAGLNSVQVFTSSGTWTRPSGITKVIMEVQGGGGGGNKGASYHWSGAAGGYAKKFLDVSSISTSTITVGAGGAGAGAGVTANGVAGGNSIWSDGTNTVTGNGGAGAVDANATTAGGTATGGDINITGQGAAGGTGGMGNSQLGSCGVVSASSNLPANSGDGKGYGGGGNAWGGYAFACGSGSGGIVIVWEYK
jgi:hypothetical protein